MTITAQALAHILGGSIEGNALAEVNRPAKIEEATEGSIAFLSNLKYENYAYTTGASILLVSRDFVPKHPISATLIRVDDVYASVAMLLQKFGDIAQSNAETPTVSPQAWIHDTAKIGSNVAIGPFVVVEAGAIIGDNAAIFAHAYIGKNAQVGANTTFHSGVKLYHDCQVGTNCIVHANAVIGADGFGFAPQADGSYQKIPQLGNVVIENNVEIGANTAIDRATMGSTVIRTGAKLDNLIQIAHNVEIGSHTVIAGLSAIAGSTKIGQRVMIGGQVGIVGHIQIADGTKIQGQSGVNATVKEPNTAIYGSPAMPYNQFLRAYAVFRKLPDLVQRVTKLEK